MRQREEISEDHIDCGTALSEICVFWMMLGGRYPALTAFEEALFIRQRNLGVGAMEVASLSSSSHFDETLSSSSSSAAKCGISANM